VLKNNMILEDMCSEKSRKHGPKGFTVILGNAFSPREQMWR
jgi:hypothetical protein